MNNNYAIMNLIIILAKKHIYRQRLEKKKPRLDIFLTELRGITLKLRKQSIKIKENIQTSEADGKL